MPATGSGGFSGSFSGRVGVSREQSFYLVVFGSQAYRRDGYRVHRRIGATGIGFIGVSARRVSGS